MTRALELSESKSIFTITSPGGFFVGIGFTVGVACVRFSHRPIVLFGHFQRISGAERGKRGEKFKNRAQKTFEICLKKKYLNDSKLESDAPERKSATAWARVWLRFPRENFLPPRELFMRAANEFVLAASACRPPSN